MRAKCAWEAWRGFVGYEQSREHAVRERVRLFKATMREGLYLNKFHFHAPPAAVLSAAASAPLRVPPSQPITAPSAMPTSR